MSHQLMLHGFLFSPLTKLYIFVIVVCNAVLYESKRNILEMSDFVLEIINPFVLTEGSQRVCWNYASREKNLFVLRKPHFADVCVKQA